MGRYIKNSESGFTLVEIMVSAVIVGLLAALSMNAFNIYQDKVRLSKVKIVYNQTATLGQDMLIDGVPAGLDPNGYYACSYSAYFSSDTVYFSTGMSPSSAAGLCFSGSSKIEPILRGLKPKATNYSANTAITFNRNQVLYIDTYIYNYTTAVAIRCNNYSGGKMSCTGA